MARAGHQDMVPGCACLLPQRPTGPGRAGTGADGCPACCRGLWARPGRGPGGGPGGGARAPHQPLCRVHRVRHRSAHTWITLLGVEAS